MAPVGPQELILSSGNSPSYTFNIIDLSLKERKNIEEDLILFEPRPGFPTVVLGNSQYVISWLLGAVQCYNYDRCNWQRSYVPFYSEVECAEEERGFNHALLRSDGLDGSSAASGKLHVLWMASFDWVGEFGHFQLYYRSIEISEEMSPQEEASDLLAARMKSSISYLIPVSESLLIDGLLLDGKLAETM